MVKYNKFNIILVCLDPFQGAEIQKTRPCVIISPNEMNHYIRILIVAPMTNTIKNYPTRIPITFDSQQGEIVLDQLRTIDKSRVIKKLGEVDEKTSIKVTQALIEMFS